ncbi:MAG TPA: SagB/ThcOx family dehydrogenase [Pyrinomonadaceae bacterium]|nr:SagB/ThcOx family dehydrogenase [Pyrinomonadaceae bacterium]
MIEIERQALKKFSGKGFRGPLQTEASLSEIFHENTKLTPISSRAYGAWIGQIARSRLLTSLMAQAFKTYTLMDQVVLPPASPQRELEDLIANRRSTRHYAGTSASQEELARLLYFSYGITDTRRNFRAVASGGGLYPLEIYAVALKVEDLEQGIYHYNIEQNCLDTISRGDRLAEIKESIWFEDIEIDDAALLFIVTAVFERSTLKYQDRGYRMILMEAGEVAQNMTLEANALGLGVCLVGGFHDNNLSKILEIDGSYEAPLLPIVVGRIA